MIRLLLLFFLFTTASCTGLSESVKHYAHTMGDKVCDTKDSIITAIQPPLGAILPPFVVGPVVAGTDALLTFGCETFHLGTNVTGEVIGGAVDPITTVTNIVSPTPIEPATGIVLPELQPFPQDGSGSSPSSSPHQ